MRFLIAGSGTAEAELKAQAERLGLMEHGSFVGWTGDDELHSLYRIADLCLVPSIYEPFGLVALEAMASGCPCIVADTGGLREVVPGGGRVGLRFRPKDSKALGRMAEQILTDDALRDRLVAEAREHVLRFDWADVARQTAAVYARSRRRRHDRVGADRGPGRDARAGPSAACAPTRAPSPIAIGSGGSACRRTGGSTSAPAGSTSESTAHSPTTAPAPTVTDDSATITLRSPIRAPAPIETVPPAASIRQPRAEQAAVAEPHAAAVDPHARTARDLHVAARLERAAGAGAQPREPQSRGELASRAAGRPRRRRWGRGWTRVRRWHTALSAWRARADHVSVTLPSVPHPARVPAGHARGRAGGRRRRAGRRGEERRAAVRRLRRGAAAVAAARLRPDAQGAEALPSARPATRRAARSPQRRRASEVGRMMGMTGARRVSATATAAAKRKRKRRKPKPGCTPVKAKKRKKKKGAAKPSALAAAEAQPPPLAQGCR